MCVHTHSREESEAETGLWKKEGVILLVPHLAHLRVLQQEMNVDFAKKLFHNHCCFGECRQRLYLYKDWVCGGSLGWRGQEVKIGGNELIDGGKMQLVRVGYGGPVGDGLRGDLAVTELRSIPLLCTVCLLIEPPTHHTHPGREREREREGGGSEDE